MAVETDRDWYKWRLEELRKGAEELGLTLQEYLLMEVLVKLEDIEVEIDGISLDMDGRAGRW